MTEVLAMFVLSWGIAEEDRSVKRQREELENASGLKRHFAPQTGVSFPCVEIYRGVLKKWLRIHRAQYNEDYSRTFSNSVRPLFWYFKPG